MLIDELRSEVEEMSEKLDFNKKEAEKRLSNVKQDVAREMNQLKSEKKELLEQIAVLEEKLIRFESVEQQNTLLNQQLEEIQKDVEENKVDRCSLDQLKLEQAQQLKTLTEDTEQKRIRLDEEMKAIQIEIQTKTDEIKQLKQSLEDQIEERKIHEKRGVMYVRELKKQLNNEKKQKERLQEKFGDLLSEMPLDVSSQSFETTSVGSWSFLSSSKEGQNKKNSSSLSIQSGSDEREMSNGSSDQIHAGDTVPSINISSSNNGSMAQNQLLEQENTMLVARITQLQQEKWMLEERLNQLTILNEEISTELQNKQKVIAFYCMERRSEPRLNSPANDKFTVKKVVDFIKDKGDDNLKEINRKLQRMLEETLIKNMHLQTNLETLSRQIHDQATAS
jgi:hypothetical protein